MKKVSVTIALMCGVLSVGAQAQTCIDAPDCKTLGYLYSEKECQGMSSVRCPYDGSRYFCIQGSTDAYDSNIGDILYDDFTTSPNIISTKKPIGVVITTGRDVNYAIALQNVKDNEQKFLYSSLTKKAPYYTTQGTIFGDWEVPTIDLLQMAYYNKDKVNETINRVGGMVLTGSYMALDGNLSMVDGSNSDSGVMLRSVIKINSPVGKSYQYTLENCAGAVDGAIYHGKFELCRMEPKVGDYVTNEQKFVSYSGGDVFAKVIGIVFDAENRLAVALTDVSTDGSAGSVVMEWAENAGSMDESDCDVNGLEECSRYYYNTCAVDGQKNTEAILNTTCHNDVPAAKATQSYQPANCVTEFCKKGKWFLPSMRDLENIDNSIICDVAFITLSSVGGKTPIKGDYRCYWSSNESTSSVLDGLAYQALQWCFQENNNYPENYKDDKAYVRPVVKF